MSGLKFTEEHEWLWPQEDGAVIIGITDYAQEQLGDVVFVELPNVGDSLMEGSEAAAIESVKAASEIKSPIGGEVVAVNEALPEDPGRVNADPMGDGWFFKLLPDDADDLDELMDEDAYQEFVKDL